MALAVLIAQAPGLALATDPACRDVVRTTGSDHVWALLFPYSAVAVVAPSLDAMLVEFRPPFSALGQAIPVVARLGFDQSVQARPWNDSNGTTDPGWFRVSNHLVGVAANGTWTVLQSMHEHPGGLQLRVGGCVFDDVMPATTTVSAGAAAVATPIPGHGSEPIEAGGGGRYAADMSSPVKTWNLHEQRRNRYDAGLLVSQNTLNAEQDPVRARFHRAVGPHQAVLVATAADSFWAHLAPGSQASVTAPNGQRVTVTYPILGPGACSPLASGLRCLDPVVARVSIAGHLLAARLADAPDTAVPAHALRVEGSAAGAPADGTWTLDPGRNRLGGPAGMRVAIQGKTFDHVAASAEPIEGRGPGDVAGGVVGGARTWNWHRQVAAVHHTGPGTEASAPEYPGGARLRGMSLDVPGAHAWGGVDLPAGLDKVRLRPLPEGGVVLFLDADADGRWDEGEFGLHLPAPGAGDPARFLPPPGRLSSEGFASTGGPDTFRFRARFESPLPAVQAYLFIDGGYATLLDAASHGLTGPHFHRMAPAGPYALGAWHHEVTLQLQAGPHTFQVCVVDPLLRAACTPEQAGPRVR